MDKRLGLFEYDFNTIWMQSSHSWCYVHNNLENCGKRFLYGDESLFLEMKNEIRIGPYEMVEW